jgi:hypothetical protein
MALSKDMSNLSEQSNTNNDSITEHAIEVEGQEQISDRIASAMNQVNNMTEVLERVLKHVPWWNVVRLQRVNQYFRNVIVGSLALQTEVYMVPRRPVMMLGEAVGDPLDLFSTRRAIAGMQAHTSWQIPSSVTTFFNLSEATDAYGQAVNFILPP